MYTSSEYLGENATPVLIDRRRGVPRHHFFEPPPARREPPPEERLLDRLDERDELRDPPKLPNDERRRYDEPEYQPDESSPSPHEVWPVARR